MKKVYKAKELSEVQKEMLGNIQGTGSNPDFGINEAEFMLFLSSWFFWDGCRQSHHKTILSFLFILAEDHTEHPVT